MISTDSFEKLHLVNHHIDNSNIRIIDNMVRNFFVKNRDLIDGVFSSRTEQDPLHYSVVLKRDSIQFRNAVLRFFEVYDLSRYSERYPVYFQFVPPALAHKLNSLKKINIS